MNRPLLARGGNVYCGERVLNFTAIDFETANSYRGSVCAAGIAVVENNVVVSSDSCLVRPKEMRFDPVNIGIHGITPEMVKEASTFDIVWRDWLLPSLSSGLIVAHSAAFDTSVLRCAFRDHDIIGPELNYACTYRLARAGLPDLLSHRLPDVADALDIPCNNHHNPKEDAEIAAKIAVALCVYLEVDSLREALQKVGLYQGKMWHGGWSPCGRKPPKNATTTIQACAVMTEPPRVQKGQRMEITLLTQAEYARYREEKGLRGHTPAAVNKKIKAGQLTVGSGALVMDGDKILIHPARADAEWPGSGKPILPHPADGPQPGPKNPRPDMVEAVPMELLEAEALHLEWSAWLRRQALKAPERWLSLVAALEDFRASWEREGRPRELTLDTPGGQR